MGNEIDTIYNSIYLRNTAQNGSATKPTEQKVSNAQIVGEMQTLAKLSDCAAEQDLISRFFSKITSKLNPKPEEKSSAQKVTSLESDVKTINDLPDDLSKIIEYNKKYYDWDYYGVIDKKTCQLTIFDKSGNAIKSFTVGIGKTIGDGLSNYYKDRYNKTMNAWKAELYRYTTPGEFTLDEIPGNPHIPGYMGTDGTLRSMSLKGDNIGFRSGQPAIHVVYKNSEERIKGIMTEDLSDNRMSYGCVNLLQEDYDAMHEYLGEGDKIYILPEEEGNSLKLEKQPNGKYVFCQQYHKEDRRGKSITEASKVWYNVRPDKAPNAKK